MRLQYFSSGPRERVLDAVLAAGHEVAAVYATDPGRSPKVAPTLQRAAAHGIPVRVIGGRNELPRLGQELAGETCLSVGFRLIFPPDFLSFVGACLNVHGTLLPDYPGARSLNWVIECGERESGVTVHLVDAGVDTGPVIVQRSFPISRFETGRSLARKTLAFEPAVVAEALAIFQRFGAAAARPQPPSRGKSFPDRFPQHSRLDPSRRLAELYNQIRAADPDDYPAHFFVDGEKVCIRMWRPEKPADEWDLV
jgi:methionyl-tRNA formyltransferase